MDVRAHLAEAFRWSAGNAVGLHRMAAAGIALAAPVALAASAGRPAAGLTAALGALMVGSAAGTEGAAALATAAAAAVAATLAAGHGWLTDLAVVLLAVAASVLGGYSRPAAVATTRFVVYLVIAVHAAAGAADPWAFLGLVIAGAAAAAILQRVVGRFAAPEAEGASAAALTAAQRRARWRRSLAQPSGWQFPLRLGACLAGAALLQRLWPGHHLHWIALTVAILSQRPVETLPVRLTQRAVGTVLGVLAAGLLLVWHPPAWALAVAIAALAALRPLLRRGSYLAYTIVTTPLMVLLLDAGQEPGVGILADRLVATLLGGVLVVAANLAAARAMARTS